MISHVYVFRNGMVMVLDHNGQQLNEYQGKWEEMMPRILAAASDNTLCVLNSDWPPNMAQAFAKL